MKNSRDYIDRFLNSIQKFQSIYENIYFSKKIDIEKAMDADLVLSDIQAFAIILRKKMLKKMVEEDAENPWAWYYYSTFLRHSTDHKERAFSYALKSVGLLEKSKEYVGAISRNFITLAIDFESFDLVDKEIRRLSKNPNKDSQILFGVVQDLSNIPIEGYLSKSSIQILNDYAETKGES